MKIDFCPTKIGDPSYSNSHYMKEKSIKARDLQEFPEKKKINNKCISIVR